MRPLLILITLLIALPVNAQGLQSRTEARRQERLHRASLSVQRSFQRKILRSERAAARIARTNRELQLRREALLRAVNVERAKENLEPLTMNEDLQNAAQAHAKDLQRHSYFSHIDRDGGSVKERVKATGYPRITIDTCNCRRLKTHYGESLAKGQWSVDEVMTGWMGSPGHRENILSRDFTELGVGLYADVWVQNFGGVKMR